MRNLTNWAIISCLLAAPVLSAACSDESDEPSDNGAAGTAGAANDDDDDTATGGKKTGDDDDDTATGGKKTGDDDDDTATGGKKTGDDDDDDSSVAGMAGMPETGNGGAAGMPQGQGGNGGAAPETAGAAGAPVEVECDLSEDAVADLPHKAVKVLIESDMTLTSGTVWQLNDKVHVADGATLTIEPCTRIEGNKNPIGVLVIERGGKIMADGKADQPIVFTSKKPEGERAAGDWGGVILLGKATNFKGGDVLIEGLDDEPANKYGGSSDDDNSGVMRYVRIEFGGYELKKDVEINGLTFGSIGSGTVIENIMVNTTLDDCFEWFGGTVNVKNLVCNEGGDDMFDADQGYRGTMTNLFGRGQYPISDDPNGFEMDSSLEGASPITTVDVKHATLCGPGETGAHVGYGMVLRESLMGNLDDVVATGFDYGVDVRDPDTDVTIENSALFGMNTGELANPDDTLTNPDPGGVDEEDWFADGTNNTTDSQGFTDADCLKAAGPNAKVTGSGVGAFSESADWLEGKWLSWVTE